GGGAGVAHNGFAGAVVVIPGVVEEGQAFVDGGVHDFDGLVLVLDRADVPAAQGEDRDADAGLAERPGWQSRALVRAGGGTCQAGGRGPGQGRVQEFTAAVVRFAHGASPETWIRAAPGGCYSKSRTSASATHFPRRVSRTE